MLDRTNKWSFLALLLLEKEVTQSLADFIRSM